MLTPRQRNQIKAALTFWNAVAETSRVHPIEHPKVQQFFQGDLTSLTAEEIDDLITFFNLGCDQGTQIVTIPRMIRSLEQPGLTAARLKAQIKRDGVESIRLGSADLYSITNLLRSARRIRERDTQTEQRYRATKKPPSADGDKSG